MFAFTRHQAIQDGDVLTERYPHPLRCEYRDVTEEPPQTVLVDHRLLQEAVARATRHELVEFGIQFEEFATAQLFQPIGQQLDMDLPQALSARLVQAETGLQNARRLDQKAKAVTILV